MIAQLLHSCDQATCIAQHVLHHMLQVVGGFLMHQTRNTAQPSCDTGFAKLVLRCSAAVIDTAASAQGRAYGIDPAFNARSPLFNADVYEHAGDYYNVSDGSPQVSLLGVPYGVFARPLPDFGDDGFPVVFPVRPSTSCETVTQ